MAEHTTHVEEPSPMHLSPVAPETTRVVLQVRAEHAGTGLRTALRAARRGLSDALDTFGQRAGGPRAALSEPLPAPGGPIVLVTGLGPDDPSPRALARQLTERLVEAGLADANVVTIPDLGRFGRLHATPNAAVLRILPVPNGNRGRISASWLTLAISWALHDPDDLVGVRVAEVEFETDRSELTRTLGECLRTHTPCEVVSGDPASWISVAALAFEPFPHLVLAAAGPHGGMPRVLAACDDLRAIAQDLPRGAAYACIDLEADLASLTSGFTDRSWRVNGMASPNAVATWTCEDYVPGVFPYQVLGPGHQLRIGGVPSSAELLRGGRIGIQVGDTGAWAPTAATRPWQQATGRALLEGCLMSHDELEMHLAGLDATSGRGRASDDPGQVSPGDGIGADPDLDQIHLTSTPQRRRGHNVTILELAAWLGGQPHSDNPVGVSPCAASFVRRWSADLDPANRQHLVARAPALPGSAGDEGVEQERRWAIAEWLAYDHASAWLRVAGISDNAGLLDQLGPLDDESELLQAVTLLGQAIVTADRLTDDLVAATVAALDPSLQRGAGRFLANAANGAWRGVLGPTAWVAAATAATYDVPASMIGRARQQLAGRGADQALQARLAAEPNALAERVWTATLHAVGDEVWHQGWCALDAMGATLTNLDVSGARAALAARSGGGELNKATGVARRAAREVLVRAALFGAPDDRRHAWDAALAHARSVPGSEAWRAVTDAVRAGVGEWTWGAALDAARSAIEDPLRDLPGLVGRTTLVSVAAEAAAAAARSVATQAAAAAMLGGAGPEVVHRSAYEALAPTAAELTASALTLFDQLIGLVVVTDSGETHTLEPGALVR